MIVKQQWQPFPWHPSWQQALEGSGALPVLGGAWAAQVLILVQARLESLRFPEKVMALLLGQPMLLWQLDRLRRVQTPHELVVALPRTPASTTALGPLLERHGYTVRCPDVPPADVLGRFAAVVRDRKPSVVVRVCGDCPLIDPQVIDQALALCAATPGCDYVALAQEWPEGTDCEIIRASALLLADSLARTPSDREHVSPYLWRQPEVFPQRLLPCPFNLSQHCWSVDTPADLDALQTILGSCLWRHGTAFGWREVYDVLRHAASAGAWATSRPRNAAFVAQVEAETGSQAAGDWFAQRYGEEAWHA